jgi:hypothetical protein
MTVEKIMTKVVDQPAELGFTEDVQTSLLIAERVISSSLGLV